MKAMLFVGLAVCLAVQTHAASVSAIPEFLGQYSEDFERLTPRDLAGPNGQVAHAGPVPILGGYGVLSGRHTLDVRPIYVWNTKGGFSLDDVSGDGHVAAIAYDGLQGVHLVSILGVNPIGRIEFAQPLVRFGGYWHHAVTRDEAGPVTVRFFDAFDSVIAESAFDYNYAGLRGVPQWFGWESSQPVYAVEFTGFWASVDGMQVDLVPEPATGTLFAIAGIVVALHPSSRRLRRPQV